MSSPSILSITARPAHFPNKDMRVQGSAQAQRMPAMIAKADLDDYLGQSMRNTLIMHFNCEY